MFSLSIYFKPYIHILLVWLQLSHGEAESAAYIEEALISMCSTGAPVSPSKMLSPELQPHLSSAVEQNHFPPPDGPVSPQFFKMIISVLGSSVLALVNSNLSSGVVPKKFKLATVQPLIKNLAWITLPCLTLYLLPSFLFSQKSWRRLFTVN